MSRGRAGDVSSMNLGRDSSVFGNQSGFGSNVNESAFSTRGRSPGGAN